jgi:hypothetical protein
MRGHINVSAAALCLMMPIASFGQTMSSAPIADRPAAAAVPIPVVATPPLTAPAGVTKSWSTEAAALVLPEGTPVTVATEADISSSTNHVGDEFKVTVVGDVIASGVVVIPKGTSGYGEVTFLSRDRSFGAAGMLGITLRSLDLNGKSILLDGHYRQEGKGADGAAVATYFAVGVFAGFVKGKNSVIPRGRALKARTGQDIPYSIGAPTALSARTTGPATPAASAVAAAPTATAQPAGATLPPATDVEAQPAADQRSSTKNN